MCHRLTGRAARIGLLLSVVVFLSARLIVGAPRRGRVHVCSRQVSVRVSRRVSYTNSYQDRTQTKCKLWGWGPRWDKCTAYRRRYSRAYRIDYYTTYSTNYYCCNGWVEDRLGGCSIPKCVPGCGVGGTCVSPNTCSCRSGYEGSRCDDINECDNNNGRCPHRCVNTRGSYYCQCYNGYDKVDGQCKAACHPPCIHGECTSPDYCQCEVDYVGDACDDLNECWSNNGGCAHRCDNFLGGFQCECFTGYTLSRLTECLPVCEPQCENNGRCSGPNNCDCPDTYTGDICEEDVDECLVSNGGCDHICENLPGRFSCSCRDGFVGTSTCTDIDECTFSNCHTCTNSPGSFECFCEAGYETTDSYNCEDVDECVAGVDGCTQNCSNTVGSFTCDCHDGWTLNPDGKSCAANPCVEIGVPFNGTRNCTGFKTGDSCVFKCGWNYRLLGSYRRECLPNGVWDGQVTRCEEILCPEIPSPSNGYTFFPCENKVSSRCRFGCDFGYFLEDDTVTECQLSGLWNSSAPACIEIKTCMPSPCQNGVCRLSQNEEDGYYCDCSGTGYTGKDCEDGFVTTPDWSEIWVDNTYQNLKFIAKPKQTLELKIVADPNSVVVEPTQLFFTSESEIQTVSIRGINQGFTTISYVLRGKGVAEFKTPEDDELFVNKKNLLDNGYVSGRYFRTGYQLPLGCFVLSDQSVCSGLEVELMSTEKWETENAATQTCGVVSVVTKTFELPVNLIGHSTTSSSKTTTTSRDNCQSEGITLDDVQDFVQISSLYRTYTRQLEHVLPDWITFISVNIDPSNSKTSLSTLILSGNEVKAIKWCSSAPVISNAQYSVYLLYKAELTIGGRHVALPLPPSKGKYCFVVGVCNVASGTVMMMFPEGSRDLLSYIKDIDYDDSMDVEVNGLAFSTTDKLNPNGRYGQDDDKISLLVNLQYTYNINQTVSARLQGSGDLHVTLENATQLFCNLFTRRWLLQQYGQSQINLFWKMLGEDVSLKFNSKQVQNPILNASIGGHPTSENLTARGIVMESSTSHGVFDDTPFSWLLNTQNIGSSVHVFVRYDLTPSLSIPSNLNSVTEVVKQLQNIPTQLSTLAEQLMTFGYGNMYSPIRSTASYLSGTIKHYFQVLSGKELKPIANSLSELRIQCKESLKSLRYVNDTLFSMSDNQHNGIENDLHNITQRLEKLSNQILTEVQNVFVYETTSGSGFRMTSEVCISSYLCFPSLEVEVLNSLSNASCKDYTQLQQTDSSRPMSEVCITGKYTAKEKLNQFISIPASAKLSLALRSNENHWLGSIPIFTNVLGIEQMTTMHLTMPGTYFNLSGKLWGLFDMEGNVTSGLDSFESMVLHVNGDISVEGPFSLGRMIKDKIITLSQKSVHDSERRLDQCVKSVETVKSRLDLVLEEQQLKKDNVDKANKKYASAEDDLLAENLNVERTRESLDEVREDTQEMEEQLNNVCEVHECSGICLPGSTIVTVTEDVMAYVPYQCCGDRTELAVVEESTSCCWSCEAETPIRSTSFSLNPIKFVVGSVSTAVNALAGNWVSAVISLVRLVSAVEMKSGHRMSYKKSECCRDCKKPVEIEVVFASCSTCVDYQIVGQVEKLVTEEVACSTQMPDPNCVRRNEECRKTRSKLFEQLKLTTPDLAAPIEELDNAVLHASIAEAALNEALIKLEDAVSKQQEVSDRVLILEAHLNNTQSALKEISEDVRPGLAIKELQINGSIEASLEFKGLQFDIDLVGEDITVIPVVCDLTLASVPVQIQIFIDVNNLNYTIENAALFITEELFGDITRSVRRRREPSQRRLGLVHHRNRRDTTKVIEQPPIDTVNYNVLNNTLDYNISSGISRDQNIVQNEARCEDLNDILSFVKHSFQTLLEISNIRKVANVQVLGNVDTFHNEYIYNLSTSSSSSEVVNNSAALQYFNLTLEDIKEINTISVNGLEQNALTKVIDSAKVKTNNTKSLLEGEDILSRWEVVMETYTRNSSGLTDCKGFHDCLTTELISLKYLSEGRQSYKNVIALDEYVSILLDKDTLTVHEAETSATDVLNQINFLQDYNDICFEEPTITEHPEPRIVIVEGNDVTLTCQASGHPPPVFSWKFNDQTLTGRNSNLLHLKEVNASDSGSYTCHAKNAVTSVQSLQCDITVEFAPSIIEQPQNAVIEHGNPEGVFFTCRASALPLANYQWYFQPSSSLSMRAIPGQNASGIEILSPGFSQDGGYTCEVWNAHGKQMSNPARLNVLGVSMPEFSSDITITLYRLDDSNSTDTNKSLGGVIADIIRDDEPEVERLNYKEFSPAGKTFLTEISFDLKSTNVTSIDIVNASREESAYQVQDKIDSIRVKVAQLNDLFTPGEIFEHRGELIEVTGFNAGINGPICPNTQYAHQDGYICVNCPPGSYRRNDKLPAICQLCPVGFYQPKEGQAICQPCPIGFYQPKEGQAICQLCPIGFYQPKEGQTKCLINDGDIVPDLGPSHSSTFPSEDGVSPSGAVMPMSKMHNNIQSDQHSDEIFAYAIGASAGAFVCLALVVSFIGFIVCRRKKSGHYYVAINEAKYYTPEFIDADKIPLSDDYRL